MDNILMRGMEPQERDFAVLRGLFETRVMTIAHVAALYFDNRMFAAQKRLQKLKATGLIRDRERHSSEPSTLQLSKKGYDVLRSFGRLHGYPAITDTEFRRRATVSARTLQHELTCASIKVAFLSALSRLPDIREVECSTWPRLSQFTVNLQRDNGYSTITAMIKPDGFLRIQQQDSVGILEHACFLEVDTGSESQRVLAEKVVGYREYYRSGRFAMWRGGTREDREGFPVRVLCVFETGERRNNCAERLLLLQPPIKAMAWLTTATEVLNDPLGQIWLRPADYQNAVVGTPFASFSIGQLGKYRRNIERDATVDARAVKHRLLES